jgi:hypothetical protein
MNRGWWSDPPWWVKLSVEILAAGATFAVLTKVFG